MKKKTRKSGRKIGTELTFMMVLLIIVAIAALMIISITQFTNMNNQQALEMSTTGADTLMNHLESESANAFRLATLLSINPNIVAGIESGSTAQLGAATNGLLESADIDFVTFLDKQGTVVYRLHAPEKFGDSLKEKSDVADALAGNATHGFQKAETIPLSASASVPVYSKTNQIIGVIITGKRLDDSEMLDSLKEITGTELTLFRDDVRVATSIIQDGERQIGNKMAADVSAIVVTQGQTYTGRTTLNGEAYYVHYMPLVSVKGDVVGALVGAESLASFNVMRNMLIVVIVVIAIVLAAIIGIIVLFYIRSKVSRPLAEMGRNADELARGNVDLDLNVDMTSESKNEIVVLGRSFSNMAANIRQNALAAEQLAHGQVDSEIVVRSDKDILSISLRQVRDVVRALVNEAGQLTASTIRGQLSVRGNAAAFEGGYRDIVSGVNQTLDAMIKPIEESAGVLSKMAAGDLSDRVRGDYQGDHAVIKNALNGTLESLNAYVGEISATLTAMANANLDVSIVRDYKGDFAPIKQALNLIIDNFNSVLTDMNSAAEQVAAGSRQVSDGSQALASGATEQAASIEELTSTITEIAQQTRLNAENASKANQLALTAHANAQSGNERMGELQKAMTAINESSASISKIIKVIDDIAFQTNILALNAAVEAARAGQHGKGFAVVAEEVRTLAARSASAAKETTDLIESSISKTEAGTKLSDETANALTQIVGDVAKAADLVGSIATASNEQAGGIAQVNIGINQVTQVVQSNSATAEESAATSEELSGQADLLKQMIGRFTLRR